MGVVALLPSMVGGWYRGVVGVIAGRWWALLANAGDEGGHIVTIDGGGMVQGSGGCCHCWTMVGWALLLDDTGDGGAGH